MWRVPTMALILLAGCASSGRESSRTESHEHPKVEHAAHASKGQGSGEDEGWLSTVLGIFFGGSDDSDVCGH